ncbi:MAG TPA: ABC transporter permease subunit, partial [Candidatus Methylomirabilis sp.]|nr:ABC transporter permease subunit [Candidatus Methylomirabilis sp.]
WMLRLPNALPFVMAGLDVAMIFALIGAIVGEFVGSRAGLGMLIQSMNFNMDVAGQFSILIVLSAVGLVLNKCIGAIRRRILFWDPSEKARVEHWLADEAEGRQELGAEPKRPEEAKA